MCSGRVVLSYYCMDPSSGGVEFAKCCSLAACDCSVAEMLAGISSNRYRQALGETFIWELALVEVFKIPHLPGARTEFALTSIFVLCFLAGAMRQRGCRQWPPCRPKGCSSACCFSLRLCVWGKTVRHGEEIFSSLES